MLAATALMGFAFVYSIAIAALGLLAVMLVVSAILDRTGERRDRSEADQVAQLRRPSGRRHGEERHEDSGRRAA